MGSFSTGGYVVYFMCRIYVYTFFVVSQHLWNWAMARSRTVATSLSTGAPSTMETAWLNMPSRLDSDSYRWSLDAEVGPVYSPSTKSSDLHPVNKAQVK